MPGGLPLDGLRALVIEDDYFIASDLRSILKVQGADVVRLSGTITDALAEIRHDGFEFALLDINMRGEFAFLVADEFCRLDIPFAFVSGYDRTHIPPRFSAIPNWGKPYDDRQIVDGIRRLWTRPVTA